MTLVVEPDDIARRLGLELPLPAAEQWLLEQAILDAQTDVAAYLGQPITPTTYVEAGLYPRYDGTWPVAHCPVVATVSAVLDGNGVTYTITYTAGLDAANDPVLAPILRYITAAVMNSPTVVGLWRGVAPSGGRVVRSLSAEGQSVSYEVVTPSGSPVPAAGADAPGALPGLRTLDRWRVANRRIYQRPGPGPWW